MKPLLFIIILISPLSIFSQEKKPVTQRKGYAYLSGSGFFNKEFDNRGAISGGVGYAPDKHIALGFGTSLFVFKNKYQMQFVQSYLDCRYFVSGINKTMSPFIAIQPGYIFYNGDPTYTDNYGNALYKTTGRFALNAMGGLYVRPEKGLGIFLSGGYSAISFKAGNHKTQYNGLRIEAGITL